MRPLNRIQPVGPARAYDTYQIEAPYSTHWREIDCEEAECGAYANGWQTFVDEATELGQRQAWYIRNDSGRSFTEARNPNGVTEFTFRPGQPCFATHRTRLDRQEFFLKAHGDWRRRFGRAFQYDRADQWVDDFGSQQQRLNDLLEKG